MTSITPISSKGGYGANFVMLSAETNVAKFAAAAMNEKANDYVPTKGALAYTKMIGGGENTTN